MSVLDQAQNFSGGVVSAARRRDSWARKEANATDDEAREQYREAIADLTARFPDLEDVPVGGAEAFARERGHGRNSRSPAHEGRKRAGAGGGRGSTRTKPAKEKREAPSPRRKPRAAARAPKLDPGRSTPRVDRAIRETGIPAGVEAGGSMLMKGLGATVGLSLAYLLFSSAEKPGTGAAALPTVIGSVQRGLARFIGLGDVFPGPKVNPATGFEEGPGSDIAKAARRLKAAGPGKATFGDARPGTFGKPPHVRTGNKQGQVHR